MSESQEKNEPVPQDLSKFVPITHDQFFHELFRDPDVARAYLRKTLKSEAVELLDMGKLEILSTSFLTEEFRELRADVIYRVPLKSGERMIHFYTILEHKAQDDHWAIFQVTQYVAELERKIVEFAKDGGKTPPSDFLIPIVVPIIIHHGEGPFTGPICTAGLREKFFGYEEFCLCIKAILNDLSDIPDEDLPDDPNVPELNMAMRMMKYIKHENFKEKFLEILERLRACMSVPKYQRFGRLALFYAYCRAKYFDESDLQNAAKQIPNLVEEKEMSSLMERMIEKGRVEEREKMSSLMEKMIEKGRVEEREKMSSLMEKLKAEGRADSIILLLSSTGHVPQELVERIQEADSSRLDDLLLLAKKCDSVEEFEKAM